MRTKEDMVFSELSGVRGVTLHKRFIELTVIIEVIGYRIGIYGWKDVDNIVQNNYFEFVFSKQEKK